MNGPFFTKVVSAQSGIPERLLQRIKAGIPVDEEELVGINFNQKTSFEGQTLLHLAARTSLHNVQLLIAQGANVNALADHNRTALHVAALHNQENIVRYLIEKGADMTIVQTDTKETAKDLAQRKNHASIVEYLESQSLLSRISSPG